mmetsp:Transcript_9504/g.18900  ORF Transcript_9504/g.18900 Transcript_9504/m.18900 type:complete len:202 (+) Transcript_9504:519-1124(+)
MISWSEHIGRLSPCQHGTDRDTSSEGLGTGENIRCDPELLMSPEGAGTSHADLDFVAHEERSGLVAERTSGLEEGGCSGADSSFSLEGFEHDGGESAFSSSLGIFLRSSIDLFHKLLKSIFIIIRGVSESTNHFSSVSEPLVVFGLSGGSDSGQCSAMKGGLGGDDDGISNSPIMSMPPRQLNCSLVTLGTRVAKEYLIST